MKIKCRICGKVFEGHWASSLCSEECAKKRRKEINQEFRERQKGIHYGSGGNRKKSHISDHNGEAKLNGMSYGYYMAMKEGRL